MLGSIVLMCVVHTIHADPINLAFMKPAEQSTTIFPASRAVDGSERNGKDKGSLCAYTEKKQTSWWQVDLQSEYLITSLKIFRRAIDRNFKNITIEVQKETDAPMVFCYHLKSPISADNFRVKCDEPVTGRYVRITQTNHKATNPLILCEVQVFSDPALRGYQESTFKTVASRLLTSPSNVTSSWTRLHCAVECLQLEGCRNFHFIRTKNEKPVCELAGTLKTLPGASVAGDDVFTVSY